MSRPAAVTNGLRCLYAATIACALSAIASSSEPPRYLTNTDAAPIANPFEAALGHSTPSGPSDDDRYLGRPAQPAPPPVTFAKEHRWSAAHEATPFWGHASIEQTQYPLTEPLPDRAPDEPAALSPPPVACDEEPAIAAHDETYVEVTSVLGAGDALGITSLVVKPVIDSPRFPGVSLRPIVGLHALAGPTSTDLPGEVYDVSLEARMYLPLGDRWLTEWALAPGIYTDFDSTEDSLRIVGRGLGYYKWSDTLRLAVGLAYLDRQDIALLPLGGVIWTPNDDWRYELLIPRPRIAHRFWSDDGRERWIYLAGELGGGSWAVERADGSPDVATYRDYRLLAGMEFKRPAGTAWLVEAGYAFSRHLEYQSTLGDYDPDPTAVVRAALTF
jgi:hypothetical protein